MKPIHLLVIAAVLAVGALIFVMINEGGDARQGRRGAGRDDVPAARGATDDTSPAGDEAGGAGAAARSAGALEAKVRVVLPDGSPAAGAAIELSGRTRGTHTADRDGAARLAGLAAGFHTLIATHGDATGALSFELKQSVDLGTLTLAKAIWLRGTVYDTQSRPVPGARVEALTSQTVRGFNIAALLRSMATPEEVEAHCTTEGDGSFALRVGSGGTYALRVTAKGFAQESETGRAYAADVEGLDFYLLPGANINGIVTTTGGTPLGDARVLIVDPTRAFTQRVPKAETATTADGAFELTVTPSQQMILVVRATGYAAHMDQLQMPAHDLRIQLAPGLTVHLRAVEAGSAAPAPGVTVAVTYKGGFQVGDTDANGELVLPNMPEQGPRGWGSQRQAIFWGGGFVAHMENLKAVEPAEGLLELGDIELERGGVIRGKVLDAQSGEPVEGAKVRTYGGLDRQLMWIDAAPATSQADGSFELRGVPLQATVLGAEHPDYVQEHNPVAVMQSMGQGQPPLFPEGRSELRRDVSLTSGSSVIGVVRAPDGSPVAGAVVQIRDDANPWKRLLGGGPSDALTDAEGRFAIGGLARDKPVGLVAEHRSYGSSERVEATPGGVEPVAIALSEPIEIRGRVVDTEGAPVAGVKVVATRAGDDRGAGGMMRAVGGDEGGARAGVTTEKGEYIVRNAPAGDLVLTFDHPRYEVLKRPIRTVPGAPLRMGDVVLRAGAGLEGIVVDAEGVPVAAVAVNASLSGDGMTPERLVAQPSGGRTWANGATDEKGRFRLYGLRTGRYSVRAYRQGYFARALEEETGRRDIRIELLREGRVQGRVTCNGQPVAGANVSAQAGAGGTRSSDFLAWAQTGADGSFTLSPVPPAAPFTIVIRHQAYKDTTIENVTAGEREREFPIETGIRIGGVVVDEEGRPVAEVGLMVRQADVQPTWVRSGPDGRWEAGGLEPGPVTVEIGPGAFVKSEPVAVTPGDMRVRLVAARGETISGTVRRSGEEQGQLRVDAIDAAGEVAGSTWLWGTNTSFLVQGLRKGTYTLRVTHFAQAEPDGPAEAEPLAEVQGVKAGATGLEIELR